MLHPNYDQAKPMHDELMETHTRHRLARTRAWKPQTSHRPLRIALSALIAVQWLCTSTIAGEGEDKPAPTGKVVIVEGQVTDPLGAGQEGVTVTVRRKESDGSKGDALATATTNALGDFAVTSPDRITGDVWVTFSKPKFADLVREVQIGRAHV